MMPIIGIPPFVRIPYHHISHRSMEGSKIYGNDPKNLPELKPNVNEPLKCPSCGEEVYERQLTSRPPHQYDAICSHCKFKLSYDHREGTLEHVTQDELDNEWSNTI